MCHMTTVFLCYKRKFSPVTQRAISSRGTRRSSSCVARRHFLFGHRRKLEGTSSCDARRQFFLWHKNIRNVVVHRKRTFLLVTQDTSSCVAGVGLFSRRKRKLLLVAREQRSSYATRQDCYLCHKKKFLLTTQEDDSSCGRRRHSFL